MTCYYLFPWRQTHHLIVATEQFAICGPGFLRVFYFFVNRRCMIMVYEFIEIKCVAGSSRSVRNHGVTNMWTTMLLTFSKPLLYKENLS